MLRDERTTRPLSGAERRRATRIPVRAAGLLRARLPAVALLSALVTSLAAQEAAPELQGVKGPRLASEQENISALILEIEKRLGQLGREMEGTEPQEAERLIEAASKIQTTGLPRTLDTIKNFLERESFIEALARQDDALRRLDEIIALLEARQFDTEDSEQTIERLKEQRLAIKKIADDQERLLDDTRSVRERKEDAKTLGELGDALDRLRRQQERLLQGDRPEDIDPEAFENDRRLLQKALELAKKLEGDQSRLNDRMNELPEQSNAGIREGREMLSRLDGLIDRAGELLAGTERLEKTSPGARTESPDPRRAEGSNEDTRPSGKEEGEGEEGASPKEEEREGEDEEAAPGGEEPGESPDDEAVAKDSKEGETSPGETEEGAGSPEDPESPGVAREGSESSSRDGESKPGEAERGERSPSGGSKRGPSDLEVARRRQAFQEGREKLEKEAEALREEIDRALEAFKSSPLQEGREELGGARKDAESARRELARGDLERARSSESSALEGLRQARARLRAELEAAERRNAVATAGVRQEEARIQGETGKATEDLRQAARESTAESGSRALREGAEAMQKASGAMEKALRALEEGRREAAKEDGREAAKKLAEATRALEQGQKDVGALSDKEKETALQRKLAKKTREAEEKTARLERKLRRKEEGNRAADARENLGGAARSMEEASDAFERGDASLARKKQEEALERLRRAEEAVKEEKKEQLARLKRHDLEKKAREQEQLASETGRLAERSRGESASAGEKQQAERLDRASEKMDQASGELDQEELAQAERSQEEALEALRRSEQDVRREEERLEELRREQQMVSMIKALGEIKERQQEVNRKTVEVDAEREPDESRRQKTRVFARLKSTIEEQGLLSDEVKGLLEKLEEERSRVFSFMLENVAGDMDQVRELLAELETGSYTQFLQDEIVGDVERLVAALKEQLELQRRRQEEQQRSPDQQQGQPMPRRDSLVTVTAELLMLKELQVEVNRQTRRLQDIRDAQDAGEVSDVWVRALERLSQKQGSVSRLTGEILEDFKEASGAEQESLEEPVEGDADGR